MTAAIDKQALHATRWRAAMMFLVAIAFANALGYVAAVANPLIAYDNWTFVDTFLRIALEHGAGIGDYLVKRAGVDHAQPLDKLLMLVNYYWFGLDFRFEGYVAMALGLVGWLVVWWMATGQGESELRTPIHPLTYAMLAAIAAVYFSIDSLNIYLYSMVTLWYAGYLCFFLLAWASWRSVTAEVRWPLALIALVTGIIADDTAILAVIALAAALMLHVRRSKKLRLCLTTIGILLVALLLCRALYAGFGEIRGATKPEFNVSIGQRMAALAALWPDSWIMLSRPMASGLLTPASATALFGGQGGRIYNLVALLALLGHLWFWRNAWRLSPGLTWFLAVALMLFFYANVAGILLGRVFVRGALYLDQERYVSFYHLGVIAGLLMAIAWIQAHTKAREAGKPVRGVWISAAVLTVVALQVPISLLAWRNSGALVAHYQGMAADTAAVARDPAHPPVACLHGVDLCGFPQPQRERIARFLQRRQVNLFSPAFRRRHPGLAAAAGPLPDAKPPSTRVE